MRDALTSFSPDVAIVVGAAAVGSLGRKALTHTRRLGARSVVVQTSPVPGDRPERWHAAVARRADRLLGALAADRHRALMGRHARSVVGTRTWVRRSTSWS